MNNFKSSIKKTITTLILIAAITFSGGLVNAQAASVPNNFTDGSPISAEQVNANFQALVDAINTLTAVQNMTLLDKVSGSTYKLVSLHVSLGTSRNQLESNDAVITFNPPVGGATGGTLNATISDREWSPSNSPQETLDLNAQNVPGSWTLTGNTITLTFDETLTGTVSQDGNVIIYRGYSNDSFSDQFNTNTSREAILGVFVKISN